jgi:uncharacterized C2H2 Zn-finger protein
MDAADRGKAPAATQGLQPVSDDEVKRAIATAGPVELHRIMGENFAVWAQFGGLKIDRNPIDLDSHRYLVDLYMDHHPHLSVRKGAQVGLTSWQLLKLLWWCVWFDVNVGLYLPGEKLVHTMSTARLSPLIDGNESIRAALDRKTNSNTLKGFKNANGQMSWFYLFHIGGTTATESTPLDIIGFDEIWKVSELDITQAEFRVSASKRKVKMFSSTPSAEGVNIDLRFKQGTQHTWLSKCLCEDGGVDLSATWPDCVVAKRDGSAYYRCPKCKAIIRDPQNGRYVAKRPNAENHSYHISQILSPKSSAAELFSLYKKLLARNNAAAFHRGALGRPYVDENAIPINEDILRNCVNAPEWPAYDGRGLRWAYEPGASSELKTSCAMGVDQHSGNVYVVIERRGPDGKKQIVHLEVVESGNPRYWEEGRPVTPFRRVHHLMREFDVGMCVVDYGPNYNDAASLARAFPGRVFVAYYQESGSDPVRWLDKAQPREQVRKGGVNLQLKWQVYLQRYKTIDDTLAEFMTRQIFMPHPDRLMQVALNEDTNRFEAEPTCRRFWTHLQSIARDVWVDTVDTATHDKPATGKMEVQWINIKRDPHFVHAANYCRVALERMRGAPVFRIIGDNAQDSGYPYGGLDWRSQITGLR